MTGTIHSPFFVPSGDQVEKFNNVKVEGADYLLFTVSKEKFKSKNGSLVSLVFGTGSVDAVANVPGDRIVTSVSAESDFGTKGLVRVPIFGNSAFVVFTEVRL
jgi:hypothetical protein